MGPQDLYSTRQSRGGDQDHTGAQITELLEKYPVTSTKKTGVPTHDGIFLPDNSTQRGVRSERDFEKEISGADRSTVVDYHYFKTGYLLRSTSLLKTSKYAK